MSKTMSLTYYLFHFEFWCINWRYEDCQRHNVQLLKLSNFLLFSIPLFDIEFLMPLLGFCISFDLLTLFLFCELVFLLFYFYCYQPISLFSSYVIILLFFVNSFSLESTTVFRLHHIMSYYKLYHSTAYHQLLSTDFDQL